MGAGWLAMSGVNQAGSVEPRPASVKTKQEGLQEEESEEVNSNRSHTAHHNTKPLIGHSLQPPHYYTNNTKMTTVQKIKVCTSHN